MVSRKLGRTLLRRTGSASVLAVALLLSTAGAALGAVSHDFSHSIGGATSTPANPYPLGTPSDVAVDGATGDVYVTDPANHRIEKFDSAGNFLLMFGKGVNQTNDGNLCPVAPGDVCKAGVATTTAGGFQTPYYLAVDNYPGGGGEVYVADKGTGIVQKFTSGGALMTSWGVNGQKDGSDATNLPTFGVPYGIAVGGGCATPDKKVTGSCTPKGTLYVGGHQYGNVTWEYTRSGEYIRYLPSHAAFTESSWLKADPVGNVYDSYRPFTKEDVQTRIFKNIPEPGAEGENDAYEMG